MSCQMIQNDAYVVVVKLPKSLRTRCRETWIYSKSCCLCTLVTFIGLSLTFLIYGLVWVLVFCQDSPGMSLEALSIRNMTVFQNSTIAAPESPWQVNSGFNVTLSTWNPNKVAGCFSTYRRMVVLVDYRGQRILQQEIPLGFGLKPRRSHPLTVELKGDHFQLKKELGPTMEADLRSNNITLEFFFNARYLRNDRKAGWINMGCQVVAKTPSNSSQSGTNSSLLTQACEGT